MSRDVSNPRKLGFGKGNPTIVVDNMPGAGELIAANRMFKVTQPDGLTVGHFVGGQFLSSFRPSRA